ncbi:toll/interleukin-1 receptor domain-containing protein [Frankia sp. CNm7]|uniref:Toll/interleukin-1 receptor domain-containing protein n=1 Tax=Frankia nepalensis TaxID=1836974 RepID=A0A937REZ4_9ACTN|nr:toll/interleukin-1 receptor domain-containing protein [Frankia nepalensis]MBL7498781.1 toll/interleukin-1 receptor domain-containing protein [Frankia nepalensis]MBL7508355.1 toll/interleukin-1 receptor domain-containing protein [Frankia nepalensis]MBL7518447.1 toll/interleukin-1 receptor domain-containing protein [Frankia nepalensis]MBL7626184.1 toll/interleukin-1 receptor domain-containing protein [Frankia nepalensis]
MDGKRDFFLSYAEEDLTWAEWIGWVLEEAGLRVTLHHWDTLPGMPWAARLDEGIRTTDYMLLVASAAYLRSPRTRAEWLAVWPDTLSGPSVTIIPVRVEDVQLDGLLRGFIPIDLGRYGEDAARAELLGRVTDVLRGHAKPYDRPPIPIQERAVRRRPPFPGVVVAVLPGSGEDAPPAAPASPTGTPAATGPVRTPGLSRPVLAAVAATLLVVAVVVVGIAVIDKGNSTPGPTAQAGAGAGAGSTAPSLAEQAAGAWEFHAQQSQVSNGTEIVVYADSALHIAGSDFRLVGEKYDLLEGHPVGFRATCEGTVTLDGDQLRFATETEQVEPIGDPASFHGECPTVLTGQLEDSGLTLTLTSDDGTVARYQRS